LRKPSTTVTGSQEPVRRKDQALEPSEDDGLTVSNALYADLDDEDEPTAATEIRLFKHLHLLPNNPDTRLLERLKDDLPQRVRDWGDVEYRRFSRLYSHGFMAVSKDRRIWQELEAFFFAKSIIFIKPKRKQPGMHKLQGSIVISEDMIHFESDNSISPSANSTRLYIADHFLKNEAGSPSTYQSQRFPKSIFGFTTRSSSNSVTT
jgi:hypothetical protein